MYRLHALHDLSICNVQVQLCNGFAGLLILQLCHLRFIQFAGSRFDGKNNIESELLAALTNKFAIF